jgi:hypothetical protein
MFHELFQNGKRSETRIRTLWTDASKKRAKEEKEVLLMQQK